MGLLMFFIVFLWFYYKSWFAILLYVLLACLLLVIGYAYTSIFITARHKLNNDLMNKRAAVSE